MKELLVTGIGWLNAQPPREAFIKANHINNVPKDLNDAHSALKSRYAHGVSLQWG